MKPRPCRRREIPGAVQRTRLRLIGPPVPTAPGSGRPPAPAEARAPPPPGSARTSRSSGGETVRPATRPARRRTRTTFTSAASRKSCANSEIHASNPITTAKSPQVFSPGRCTDRRSRTPGGAGPSTPPAARDAPGITSDHETRATGHPVREGEHRRRHQHRAEQRHDLDRPPPTPVPPSIPAQERRDDDRRAERDRAAPLAARASARPVVPARGTSHTSSIAHWVDVTTAVPDHRARTIPAIRANDEPDLADVRLDLWSDHGEPREGRVEQPLLERRIVLDHERHDGDEHEQEREEREEAVVGDQRRHLSGSVVPELLEANGNARTGRFRWASSARRSSRCAVPPRVSVMPGSFTPPRGQTGWGGGRGYGPIMTLASARTSDAARSAAGVLADIDFGGGTLPGSESRQVDTFTCGHEVPRAPLEGADADRLDERRTSEETAEPTPEDDHPGARLVQRSSAPSSGLDDVGRDGGGTRRLRRFSAKAPSTAPARRGRRSGRLGRLGAMSWGPATTGSAKAAVADPRRARSSPARTPRPASPRSRRP